jgi:low temperature requirement protein LtrA
MHAGAPAGAPPIVPQLPIIRTRTEGEQRATFFELFFDLVYVFAVTQLSHHLLADSSWSGAAETAFMLVALYWAWNYTTWMTKWFDPDTVPVRLVLVFVMLASLLLAVAIPEGFSGHALLFACAYSGLQIGRNTFVVAVTPRGDFNQNFRQILAWSVLSAPLWVAGGIVDAEALRWVLWLGALVLIWLRAADLLAAGGWNHAHEPVADRGGPFRRALPAVRDHRARGERRAGGRHRLGDGLSVDVVAALLLAFLSSTAL